MSRTHTRPLSGTLFRALCLAAACLSTVGTAATEPAGAYHDRADRALQSLLLRFWDGGRQYLRHNYPDTGALTGYWTYANGWEALLDNVERTGGRQYRGLIESFYLGQDERGWYAGYYDDECWMTQALIHAYDLTGQAKYLDKARELYADIMSAWDTGCCGATPGGLWWDRAHTQKATAANAGAALAGARLYLRTGEVHYLEFAEQAYSYWYDNMVSPSTFQVADHFETNGTKVWWRFTYNEGLMIGAGVELFEATGDEEYMNQARRIANFMVANEVTPTLYGNVLYDGTNSSCGGDCSQFKGPAYRQLMRLHELDPSNTQYLAVLQASADAIWELARNPISTIFSTSWSGPAQSDVDQGRVNAACTALSRFAQQYEDYPGSGIPHNRFEAENATVHHIALAADCGDYTGWGYVGAWNADGQSVDFEVHFPAAGSYTLEFRYAAGAGNASRLIRVDGATAIPNLPFTDTGSWSVYQTRTITRQFDAGRHMISVVYDSSARNANWLNLDSLTIPNLPPDQIAFTRIEAAGTGGLLLTWNTVPGQAYRLQSNSRVTGGGWSDLGLPVWATDDTLQVRVPAATDDQEFYRVVRR